MPSLGEVFNGYLTMPPYDGRDERDADERLKVLERFSRRCTDDDPLAFLCADDDGLDDEISFAPLRAIQLNLA